MTEPLEKFVEACMPLPGVAAWSIRDVTGAVSHCRFNERLSAEQVEQALLRLALATENLRQHDIDVARLCWVFSDLLMFVALRNDGACLALFVPEGSHQAYGPLQNLLQEFLRISA